jgi:hypothetical protein
VLAALQVRHERAVEQVGKLALRELRPDVSAVPRFLEQVRVGVEGHAGAVQINPFALRVFDELFPGWDEPWTGLARPGPGALMDLFGSARGKRLLRRQAMSPND